ncbi:MAG: PKD domain-containing protein [Acidimicrobiales bacterium]
MGTAYHFSSTATGSGQTVAIIDWGDDPTVQSDLNTFDTEYHLAACTTANGCFKKLNQSGAASPLPSDQGAAGEISLDVEAVHSVCQKCAIDLIEVDNNSFASTGAGVDKAVALHATEISNSYGGADSTGLSPADMAAYNHPGVVITVSTGDDGYYGFDTWINTPPGGPAANPGAPNFPAELATVVSVGGTSLGLNSNGTRQSETAWNDDGVQANIEESYGVPLGASGGGCSLFVNAPTWQKKLKVWPLTACGTKRLAADVSAVADPFTGFDTYNTSDGGTGWETIGGTSLSSPVIAAIYALAGGSHGMAYPALTLYAHLHQTSLYDVTAAGTGFCDGENASQCGNANQLEYDGAVLGVMDCDFPATGNKPSAGDLACDAGAGYDGPSGVGTPNGLAAFAKTGPTVAIGGPKSVTHGTTDRWTASVKDPFPGSSITRYTWSWGDGSASTTTTTGSATHDYGAEHSRRITVTIKDSYGVTGTATYAVTVS